MHQMRISTTKVSSVVLRPEKSWKSEKKKCEKSKEPKNQLLCREIEPNPSKDRAMHEGDNPSFLDKFMKFIFYLIILFIFVYLSKYRST